MDKTRSDSAYGPWSRMLLAFLVFAAFVILPFIIWGERMDGNASELVQRQATRRAIALIGVALLVLDLLLPVPSSLVSISLCLLLGPAWGALAVFVGMVGAFMSGYALGCLLPTARLRDWVGAHTWDSVATTRRTGGLAWIAASRPVPVLAEVIAVFAGSLRMPFVPSLAAACASSLLVSVTYGFAGWLGLQQGESSIGLLALSAACLPVASWAAFQWWRRWARSRPSPDRCVNASE